MENDPNVFNPMAAIDDARLRRLRSKIAEWGPADRASTDLTSAEAALIVQVIDCGLRYATTLRDMNQRIASAETQRQHAQKAHAEQVILRQHAERKRDELLRLRANTSAEAGEEEEEPEEEPSEWVTAEDYKILEGKIAAVRVLVRAVLSATEDDE